MQAPLPRGVRGEVVHAGQCCGYTPPVIHGTLGRLHLGDLLQWLEMAGASGRLLVRQGGWDRHLDLLHGRVAYVSSTHPGERPAAWLARRRAAAEPELRAALARSLLGAGLLTDLLGASDSDTRSRLLQELESLAYHVVYRILLGGEAEFRFDPDYPVPGPPALNLDLDPQTLVLEAARRTDEAEGALEPPAAEPLPFSGEAFENLFWELLVHAFPVPVELDGSTLADLHSVVRDVTGTLSQWLRRSPGLVPAPAEQTAAVQEALARGEEPTLRGAPHLAWNLLALASALPTPDEPALDLAALGAFATAHDLWLDLTTAAHLRRPVQPRIDSVISRLAGDLGRAAAAAAGVLGEAQGLAELAAHLLAVPSDLCLYVLATVPIPQEAMRRTLLEHLPPRLGHGLAARAGFPRELEPAFTAGGGTLLAGALHLAREVVPGGRLLPPLAAREEALLAAVGAERIAEAAAAARAVVAGAGTAVG